MTQALIRAINIGLYEAGWTVVSDGFSIKSGTWRKAVEPVEQHIQRRIKKAIAAEREACAKVCDIETALWEENSDGQISLRSVAAVIRARGNT